MPCQNHYPQNPTPISSYRAPIFVKRELTNLHQIVPQFLSKVQTSLILIQFSTAVARRVEQTKERVILEEVEEDLQKL